MALKGLVTFNKKGSFEALSGKDCVEAFCKHIEEEAKRLYIYDGLFHPILLHLDIKLVISQKCDQAESYNLVCW